MQSIAPYTIGWLSHNPEPGAVQLLGWSMDRSVPLRPIQLSLARVRPVIHLAHRLRVALTVPDRVVLDHELVLVLHGEGEIEIACQRQRIGPGDLFVIAPFVPHRLWSGSPEFEHIAIHFDLAPELLPPGDLVRREPYQVSFTDDHDLARYRQLSLTDPCRDQVEHLVQLWAKHTQLATLQAEALLMNVVSQLLRAPALSGSRAPALDSRIVDAMRQIELQFPNPIRIPALAAVAGLGVTHFNRLFRECTNETPAAYVRRLRLKQARTLVEHSDEPIKVIAFASGFSNAAHFSRAFHALHGTWPTDLRKRARLR